MQTCRNLHLIQTGKKTSKDDVGLSREDGLIVLRDINEKQTEKMRKNIIKVFRTIGFQIEIETNFHEVKST